MVREDAESIYQGQWKDGKRHGKGSEFDRKEQSFYIGWWINDEKEGLGRVIFDSGNIYEGYWVEGVAHGKGEEKLVRGIYSQRKVLR